jgi:hypothetical protein
LILYACLFGGAGAGLLYAIDMSPALGARAKNAAGVLAAAAIGLAMWLGGAPNAWAFPLAWCAVFLLLWASAFEVGGDDALWARVAASTGLVVMLGQFFQ